MPRFADVKISTFYGDKTFFRGDFLQERADGIRLEFTKNNHSFGYSLSNSILEEVLSKDIEKGSNLAADIRKELSPNIKSSVFYNSDLNKIYETSRGAAGYKINTKTVSLIF